MLDVVVVQRYVRASLEEDRADLDLTTLAIADWLAEPAPAEGGVTSQSIPAWISAERGAQTSAPSRPRARIIARADGVLCGLQFAEAALRTLDPAVEFASRKQDGEPLAAGEVIAEARGAIGPILRAERTALNWLQRLSGTATLTAAAVKAAAAGGRARILDTRKTTPGLRAAERYAVRCGGGINHRDSLAAGILLKDNHIAAVGSTDQAVRAALRQAGPATGVEVEVTSLEQAREALAAGASALLLDNFALEALPPAVALARQHKAVVEASGGITLPQITRIAAAGVDYISLGALTHSAPALDIALDLR